MNWVASLSFFFFLIICSTKDEMPGNTICMPTSRTLRSQGIHFEWGSLRSLEREQHDLRTLELADRSFDMNVVVQLLSHILFFVTPWTAASQISLSFIIPRSFLQLMSIESVMPSNHLILCRPFLLPPSIFSSIWVSSNGSAVCIRWPKYWSFSLTLGCV